MHRGGGSGEQAHVKEVYEARVYLSLVIKVRTRGQPEQSGSECNSELQSQYRTLFLDKLVRYESLEELAKRIDMQLTSVEDELIDIMRIQSANSHQAAAAPGDSELNMVEHGAAILDLMKEDIKPLLIVIGNLKDLHVPKILQSGQQSRAKAGSEKSMLEFMTRLSYKDTKLIVVDLNDYRDDDVTAPSHLADLKLLCFITQGRYFSFSEFTELGLKSL